MKYVLIKREDQISQNQWFDYCKFHQIPYIVIKQRYKYSSVTWDYITYESKIDTILMKNREKILQKFEWIFQEYATEKSTYLMSEVSACFNNILKENAEKMAETLYNFINEIIQTECN